MTHLTLKGMEEYENKEKSTLSPSKLNPSLDLMWQRPKAFNNFKEWLTVFGTVMPL